MSEGLGHASGHDGMGAGVDGVGIVVLIIDGTGIGCMLQGSIALDR